MSKVNDSQLIADAREWEGIAEKLDYHNSILFTVNDALALYSICELASVKKLLEATADDLYTLYLQCEKKHKAITASRFAEEGNNHG